MRQDLGLDRLLLPIAFDPVRLAADLAGLRAIAWTEQFVTAGYEGDWSIIALRQSAGAAKLPVTDISDPDRDDFIDTAAAAACPYFRQVLRSFACPLLGVRLMRLGPGSSIKEHSHPVDETRVAQVHIPITTNDGVEFRLNGRPVAMPAGSVWWFRLSAPHSAANHGETDRVHMLVDLVMNDWLAALLAEAEGTAAGRAA
jgi:quercetin dioxygenase-like cupin family protein